MKCTCEDSNSDVCNKEMSKEEFDQDGVCDRCASHVWEEFISSEDYQWFHKEETK